MRFILFLFFFCIFGINYSYPFACTSETEASFKFDGHNNRRYIIYEFGLSKIYTVYIVEDSTRFDVFVSDGKKVDFATTCEMSPVLEWAFNEASDEIINTQYFADKDYKAAYYKLSLMIDDVPIVIDSSSMNNNATDALKEKIEELKRFIINLWIQYLNDEN